MFMVEWRIRKRQRAERRIGGGARGLVALTPNAGRATDPTGTASRSTTEWSSVAAQPVYRGVSRRMAASACRSPADRGTHTGPEGYREIAEVGVGAEAVRREPAPEAGARSGVEPPAVAGARVFRRLPERSAAMKADGTHPNLRPHGRATALRHEGRLRRHHGDRPDEIVFRTSRANSHACKSAGNAEPGC